jgi:hypothetical protein
MSISLRRYVNITSGVGAGAGVDARDLIARLFTVSSLVPTGSFVEFASADEVGKYFGVSSEEYARALFYFGWISKSITRPQRISFARWVNVAAAPQIFGAIGAQALASWTSIGNGSLNISLGGVEKSVTGMNFGASGSLSAVAAVVQAAIRAVGNPASFTGSIATASVPASTFTGVITTSGGVDTLTVSGSTGTISLGDTVLATGITGGTTIASFGTGTGGNGTYILSTTGQTLSSRSMTAGVIVTDTLTAGSVIGQIEVGQTVFGSGVAVGTTITALGTGTGGAGTYILSTEGQTASSTAMTAGLANTQFTACTVVWNSARQSFDFTGGSAIDAEISVTAGSTGTDIAGQLGWLSSSAIFSDGAAAETPVEALTNSANASTNFGSFTFMPTLTQEQIVDAAEWNNALNITFMYSVRCTTNNASALAGVLEDIGGVTLTLAPLAAEYPEMVPMMILAATNYQQRNSTQNYMFQFFNLTSSVNTDADANIYDALRINYYGQTQTAGQKIEFYQRGLMMGLPVDPIDQNVYANEIWLKDAAAAAIMTLLLALAKVSANSTGRAQLLNILQGVIDQALFNGSISVGKPLTNAQKLYITEITGDPVAWQQVQNIGYWFDVVITPYVEDGVTRYKAVYTLVYSKDDIIRLVEGRDILI